MCGRYRTSYDPEDWSDTRLTPYLPELLATHDEDVRPSTIQPALVNTSPWSIEHLRWGLLPTWAKPDTRPQINARRESVFTKPFWRDAAKRHRCVIVTTGFYEWSGEPRHKTKHLFTRSDRQPLVLAGLWVPSSTAQPGTFALITTDPNAIAATIHDRMPVVLETDDEVARWLVPDVLAERDVADLLGPASEDLLVVAPPGPGRPASLFERS